MSVQRISQLEMLTLMTNAPAMARNTKPAASTEDVQQDDVFEAERVGEGEGEVKQGDAAEAGTKGEGTGQADQRQDDGRADRERRRQLPGGDGPPALFGVAGGRSRGPPGR